MLKKKKKEITSFRYPLFQIFLKSTSYKLNDFGELECSFFENHLTKFKSIPKNMINPEYKLEQLLEIADIYYYLSEYKNIINELTLTKKIKNGKEMLVKQVELTIDDLINEIITEKKIKDFLTYTKSTKVFKKQIIDIFISTEIFKNFKLNIINNDLIITLYKNDLEYLSFDLWGIILENTLKEKLSTKQQQYMIHRICEDNNTKQLIEELKLKRMEFNLMQSLDNIKNGTMKMDLLLHNI